MRHVARDALVVENVLLGLAQLALACVLLGMYKRQDWEALVETRKKLFGRSESVGTQQTLGRIVIGMCFAGGIFLIVSGLAGWAD